MQHALQTGANLTKQKSGLKGNAGSALQYGFWTIAVFVSSPKG